MVAEIAQKYGLDPRRVLERVYVSRAFTAYQLFSLIRDRLDEALDKYRCGLVMVSNVADRFIDPDVPPTEAKDLFVRICSKLAAVARDGRIVVATHTSRRSKRTMILEAALFGKASIIMSLDELHGGFSLTLKKHPKLKPLSVRLTGPHVSLMDFLEV
jgi:uncharacterized protein YebE (UPF0316 family)